MPEVQESGYVRPPEGIDRLVRIADNADVSVALSQAPGEPVLRGVDILVFIDYDMTEQSLISRPAPCITQNP